jgi:hypothetical protein
MKCPWQEVDQGIWWCNKCGCLLTEEGDDMEFVEIPDSKTSSCEDVKVEDF